MSTPKQIDLECRELTIADIKSGLVASKLYSQQTVNRIINCHYVRYELDGDDIQIYFIIAIDTTGLAGGVFVGEKEPGPIPNGYQDCHLAADLLVLTLKKQPSGTWSKSIYSIDHELDGIEQAVKALKLN